ncbi:MAG: MotE family protein [Albidovulum sp.]
MTTKRDPFASRRKVTARTPRSGRGALVVVALLLGGSGVIRLAAGADHAFAYVGEQSPAAAAGTDEPVCEPDAGAFAMLEELKARESRLKAQEADLADRAQALAVAREEIEGRLASLVAAEEKLSATLTLANEAADADVARLVAVYEKMKPKDAASLFTEMDPDFAAGFLARMRPDAAAAVMAGLEPRTAYAISVLLAGRNAKAPKE